MITQLCHKSAKSGGVTLSISPLTNGVTALKTMKSGCIITWLSSGTNIIGCFHQKVRDSNATILNAMFPKVIFGRYTYVEDSINDTCFCLTRKNETLHVILIAIIVVQTASSYSFFHCCIRLQ